MAQDRKTLSKPANYDELFPGRFIKAGLFQSLFGTARPLVTIKDYDLEELPQDDGKEKARGVITLTETSMQLALNKTNGECLKAMFGTSLRDWVGKRVVLCVERDRDPGGPRGATCDAIRVYGSPDITSDMSIQIKLPQRRPYTRKLVAIQTQHDGNGAPSQPKQKPRGDIDSAVQKIHTTDPSLMQKLSEELRSFEWTDDELQQLRVAYEVRKTNG